MARHPSTRTLMLFYDGELDDAQAADVKEHKATCPKCRAWLSDLAAVGAVVRGETEPPRPVRRRGPRSKGVWVRRPWYERLLPAVGAVTALAAVIALIVANAPGTDDHKFNEGPDASVEAVSLPEPDTGAPGLTILDTDADPVVVAVMVPGGRAGDGADVVDAVAVALTDANAAGGIDGRPLELLAADADDPQVVAALTARDVNALIGGYGATPLIWDAAAEAGIAWFGPADVAPVEAGNVIAIEASHAAAGALLAQTLRSQGHERVAAISGPADERRLVEGVDRAMDVMAADLPADPVCASTFADAAANDVPVVVLALPSDAVARCLDTLDPDAGIRQVVVPATAVDAALASAPAGVSVLAALGAPPPDDPGRGPERFRTATGIQRDYRAMVSYAATELAVTALRADAGDPRHGFLTGGVFRSDFVTLNPAAVPPNPGVQVVELVASAPATPT